MLMPDLEMGYANQEEAIPALSGPAAYQTGTLCSTVLGHCVHPMLVLLHAIIQAHIRLASFMLPTRQVPVAVLYWVYCSGSTVLGLLY